MSLRCDAHSRFTQDRIQQKQNFTQTSLSKKPPIKKISSGARIPQDLTSKTQSMAVNLHGFVKRRRGSCKHAAANRHHATVATSTPFPPEAGTTELPPGDHIQRDMSQAEPSSPWLSKTNGRMVQAPALPAEHRLPQCVQVVLCLVKVD